MRYPVYHPLLLAEIALIMLQTVVPCYSCATVQKIWETRGTGSKVCSSDSQAVVGTRSFAGAQLKGLSIVQRARRLLSNFFFLLLCLPRFR